MPIPWVGKPLLLTETLRVPSPGGSLRAESACALRLRVCLWLAPPLSPYAQSARLTAYAQRLRSRYGTPERRATGKGYGECQSPRSGRLTRAGERSERSPRAALVSPPAVLTAHRTPSETSLRVCLCSHRNAVTPLVQRWLLRHISPVKGKRGPGRK